MSKSILTEKQKLIIKSFADTFNCFRRYNDLSVEELGRRCVMSRTVLYDFFRDGKNITMQNFVKLLECFGLSLYVYALRNCPFDKETMYRLLDEEWEFREMVEKENLSPRERASKRKK